MTIKKHILSFIMVLFLLSIFSGCDGNTNESVTLSQLISQAEEYNGKTVTLEAFYFGGFEISAISESVGPSTSGVWRIVPTGTVIWAEGGISQELQKQMYAQTNTPSGYTEYIGKLKITGTFETGSRYGHMDAYQYKIMITSAELLEWTPPPMVIQPTTTVTASPTPPVTSTFDLDGAITAGEKVAEDFIRNSATFKFDGIEGSIALAQSDPGSTSAFRSWSYTFKFETLHPGHGDRTGQSLAQMITTHSATIMVNLEKYFPSAVFGDGWKVMMAVCDDTWDMLSDKALSLTISGVVVSGGDTTPPGGLLDAPRVFTYRVLRDEGVFINVSYTAYPPSPVGDANKEKVTLDFYRGGIEIGDGIEARGSLDKETNTVMVAEQGDYISTFLRKATVIGVIVSIEQDTYELMRDDGTFINVGYIAEEGAVQSLYDESIQVGDFMKAAGTYDRSTNTVLVSAQDDFLKTYDHSPIRTTAVWE